MLVLSGARAGLNWLLVLRKREGYRQAFAQVDPEKVARFTGRRGGFSFVGPTIVYAHMQAIGMVVDHLVDCYRYREILREPA